MYYNNFSSNFFGNAAHISEPQCFGVPHVHPYISIYDACDLKLWYHNNCFQPSPIVVNIKIPPCPEETLKPEPINLSKLAITINPASDDILDAITKKSSGLKYVKCKKIIERGSNDLTLSPDHSKIIGECFRDAECKACVRAINASILDVRKEGVLFADEEMSVPESNFSVI